MAIKRFTKMEYKSADDMVFGEAKYPLTYGLGQKIGAGTVVPEINFAPRPGAEKNPATLTREYVDYITKDILDRAVTLGFPAVQLENEWIHQMGNDPNKFAKPVVAGQKALMQKYHDEYGIALSIRHTCADPRLAEKGLRPGMDKVHMYPEKTIESFEVAAENGADVLSVETMGGKEVSDYAILHQDIKGWLFGIGYLGSLDMEWIWPQIVDVAKKNKIIAGGDTNCAGANTSMFMAGGYLDKDIPRTFSAVTRCIASARTLVAYECGATGPDWPASGGCPFHNPGDHRFASAPLPHERGLSAVGLLPSGPRPVSTVKARKPSFQRTSGANAIPTGRGFTVEPLG